MSIFFVNGDFIRRKFAVVRWTAFAVLMDRSDPSGNHQEPGSWPAISVAGRIEKQKAKERITGGGTHHLVALRKPDKGNNQPGHRIRRTT